LEERRGGGGVKEAQLGVYDSEGRVDKESVMEVVMEYRWKGTRRAKVHNLQPGEEEVREYSERRTQ
jgi:hypothetical protein